MIYTRESDRASKVLTTWGGQKNESILNDVMTEFNARYWSSNADRKIRLIVEIKR